MLAENKTSIMLNCLYLLLIPLIMNTLLLVDFTNDSNTANWYVVDDTVMGGRSAGNFKLNNEGHGEFSGMISLENNGGFSSLRYVFKKIEVTNYSKAVIRLKGDKKKYQFRVKSNRNDYYSYVSEFTTSGQWQEIEVSFKEMYPSFRGRKLNMPNFASNYIEEITFLIGNKKPEKFKLEIDKIELK